jgi:catechol 2,3-dioxygenase-like lactoylglutathione lyase family enzyme
MGMDDLIRPMRAEDRGEPLGGAGAVLMRGGLHHLELYVSDLERSREFWGWLLGWLGYERYQEWAQGVSWKSGDFYLVLVQTQERYLDVAYHRCRVGMNHLAFHVHSRERVDELTALLRERGVRILYEDRHPFAGGDGHYAVFFEDPDRMKVEVLAMEGSEMRG